MTFMLDKELVLKHNGQYELANERPTNRGNQANL